MHIADATIMKQRLLIVLLFLAMFTPRELLAQGRPYEGPDDPAGDVAATRKGWMTGNRVYMPFFNNTQLGDFSSDRAGWPNDAKRIGMHDDIGLLIGARVYIANDSIPITNPAEIATRHDLDTLWFIQTHYRGDTKKSPDGTVEWGFYPVFGYFNELNEYPAMSNRDDSWPRAGWPSRGDELKWKGEWNGRFGRGVMYADLETYFVANDAQDQHAMQASEPVKYFPRPGIKIGYKDPNVTIQKGLPWGGLGLRIEVRAFQWNNPQSRDAVFIEYNITNASNYDVNDLCFAYYVDTGIGQDDPDGDWGYFSRPLNMTYAWDYDGVGQGGIVPGVMGLAFLESPGVVNDLKDNDDDGLTDERRDNGPLTFIPTLSADPYVKSIAQDTAKFRAYFGRPWAPHWDADEDGDWADGNDANGNGSYEADEGSGDDVGTDGVGPNDLNYSGPDANGTECNHKPDFIEGLGCEPNFGTTDIGESDMLGLTMFRMYEFTLTGRLYRSDRVFYEWMTQQGLMDYTGGVTNLAQSFASSPFQLARGRTERISLSNLFSYEELSGLNSTTHSAPALFQKKRIVQVIYEADYRFLQPPLMPTLTATARNGKVYLYWNDVADKFTHQPFLGGINDFEGYKLYKATDKYFSDAEQLRDMYGNPAGKTPIFQCDVKNGVKGASPNGVINGEPFYLGDDSGIRHSYVDENVQNGRTYYYGLVAYNYGVPASGTDGVSISPAENNAVIDLDETEEIRFVGKNVAVVTPTQQAAGYAPPEIEFVKNTSGVIGGAVIRPSVYNYARVNPTKTYKVKFQVASKSYLRVVARTRHRSDGIYGTNGYKMFDATNGDVQLYEENPTQFLMDNLVGGFFNVQYGLTSDIVDGVQLYIKPAVAEAAYDSVESGWIKGTSPVSVRVTPTESKYFAWDYRITFTGVDTAYRGRTTLAASVTDVNGAGIGNAGLLLRQPFSYYATNTIFLDSLGQPEKMDMIVHDKNFNGVFEPDSDDVLVGPVVKDGTIMRWGGTVFAMNFRDAKNQMPKPGDVYHVAFRRPLSMVDSVMYRVKAAQSLIADRLEGDMSQIKVVPNPYIMTNMLEPAVQNKSLNQRRRLMFTHVPAHSTIRIYTVSGVFIDEVAVENAPDNGTVLWDMLTKEGLEVAAGVYLYQVKAIDSGNEHFGKFAILK
jgi:hypothetical protein